MSGQTSDSDQTPHKISGCSRVPIILLFYMGIFLRDYYLSIVLSNIALLYWLFLIIRGHTLKTLFNIKRRTFWESFTIGVLFVGMWMVFLGAVAWGLLLVWATVIITLLYVIIYKNRYFIGYYFGLFDFSSEKKSSEEQRSVHTVKFREHMNIGSRIWIINYHLNPSTDVKISCAPVLDSIQETFEEFDFEHLIRDPDCVRIYTGGIRSWSPQSTPLHLFQSVKIECQETNHTPKFVCEIDCSPMMLVSAIILGIFLVILPLNRIFESNNTFLLSYVEIIVFVIPLFFNIIITYMGCQFFKQKLKQAVRSALWEYDEDDTSGESG